ncbi:MAG: hypothetical protein LBO66_11045 [Deltaproteobacteria bacterium]|jgi:hypothetical protein|nr:hypothetical protein [Deltaproteobacteria bacterium]
MDLYKINNSISSGENKFVSTAANPSLNYSLSDIYKPNEMTYAVNIIFDGGRAILSTADMNGAASPEEEELEFRAMIDIFLNNYQWLGKDSPAPRGFLSRFGVIKKNTDFKIDARYFVRDAEMSTEATSEFFFDFWPEKQGRFEEELSRIERESSIEAKFKRHFISRFLRPDSKFFGYAWHDSTRNVSYLKSYSGVENRFYLSMNHGEYERLKLMIYARGDANDNCYSDEIQVLLGKMTSADPECGTAIQ